MSDLISEQQSIVEATLERMYPNKRRIKINKWVNHVVCHHGDIKTPRSRILTKKFMIVKSTEGILFYIANCPICNIVYYILDNDKKVGYCKECVAPVYESNKIPDQEIFECSVCGHPHTKDELWPSIIDYLYSLEKV